MSTQVQNQGKPIKILVYGIERAGYEFPTEETTIPLAINGSEPKFKKILAPILHIGNSIELVFERFDTKEEFQNYDGVIMFQGIWAKRGHSSDIYSTRDYVYDQENDELLKRNKQLQQLLLKRKGFVCFLMGRMEYDDFDLAKNVLGWFDSTGFEAINDRSFVSSKRGELISYCEKYGVAKTKFSIYSYTDADVLMTAGGFDGSVGVCFEKKVFYLPCHAPDKGSEDTKILFSTLCGGLVALYKKMRQELPDWISKFNFASETEVLKQKESLAQEIEAVQAQIDVFSGYKAILATTSDNLRKDVSFVLQSGFSYEIDEDDQFLEDLKIVKKGKDGKNKIIALVEVKGVNGNVDREAINQVDSHRDRNKLAQEFPGVLIANTFIKSANSLTKKDKPIEKEQIAHAHKNHVLILRTLDLLRALDLIKQDKEMKKKFDSLLFSADGWLEVSDGNFTLHQK